MTDFVINFVNTLFTVLIFAIFARAILSWFNLAPGNRIMMVLMEITEPVIAPIRRIMPRIGMLDLSPLVAIILLQIIQSVLIGTMRAI